MQEIYYPSKDGKNTIHACIWRPEGEIKGIIQLIHGMAEYAARYSPFAEFLTDAGYLVCAEDHAGHGLSVKSADDLGYFNDANDYEIVLQDIRTLNLRVREENPDKPYFVLGHSMGSFFCRNYIARYGGELNGAVIMGTGFKGKLTLAAALSFVAGDAKKHGWRNRSRTVKKLAFGTYNKKFGGGKGGNDWLSKNPENVRAYEEDGLCGFDFTNGGYRVLFSVIKAACSAETISAVPENLPVFFVAGAEDPVGDYGKGVKKAAAKFKRAGVKDVEVKLYEDMRHEILNDDCKDEVYADLLAFFDKRI